MIRWFYAFRALIQLAIGFVEAGWQLRNGFNELKPGRNGIFSSTEFRRFRHYVFGVSYLNHIFEALLSRKRTQHEILAGMYLAALASFFDDLLEIHRGRLLQMDQLPDNPDSFGNSMDRGQVAQIILQKVYQFLPETNKALFDEYLQQLYKVELQVYTSANEEDLQAISTITAQKGSAAVLLFRSILIPEPEHAELKFLEAFGFLIQLSDDIFDVWFDHHSGTETLATSYLKNHQLSILTTLFSKQVQAVDGALIRCKYSKHTNNLVKEYVNLLASVTRVCLHRYKQIETSSGEFPMADRSTMVVDMGLIRNQLLAFRYLLFKH
ncbi:MAG: class 1 isoprenoid biosynthesis enzyme [Lewinellaceae bacterium]|nr:class 1 isoprenoid biosynthesis enzyme [Saprospiraceae bacterium]MCB9343767.1 class 1 isoprenoid biosynthesis enzyme [Lewinellaceae bacterium]